MAQEHVLIVVTVPVLLEYGGYFVLRKVVGEGFGVGDIFIVGDTTVLGGFLVVHRDQEMHLIFVTQIGTEDGGVEMRCSLILEIAAGIVVIEVEAETYAFAGIDGKLYVEAVLTKQLVTAVVVGGTGIGRQCVHKPELVGLDIKETVGVGEDEGTALTAVDEDTAQACSVVGSSGVIIAVESCIERGVHKQVGQGVGLYKNHITELPVDSPGIKAFRNLLVFLGRIVVVFVEILVFTASRDGSVFIDLVIRTFGLCGSSERSEE